MPFTRRQTLFTLLGCGLMSTLACADDTANVTTERPRRDPVLSSLPDAIRKVFEDSFPHHRCIRLATRGRGAAAVYRATFFNPASSSVHHQLIGEEMVSTPILYDLELDDRGTVLEETLHPILDPRRLPNAVRAAYQKWNPPGNKGVEVEWMTEVPRGQARRYRVLVVVNALTSYAASFHEDGTVVTAPPIENHHKNDGAPASSRSN